MITSAKRMAHEGPAKKAAHTAKWATIMAKVGIRRAVSAKPFPKWHFIEFVGPHGAESVGIIDLIAVRKDHRLPKGNLKRGDALEIVFIQVKGGSAARPTNDDARRLRGVQKLHQANHVLLATWRKGYAAEFFTLLKSPGAKSGHWQEKPDLKLIFGNAAH